MQPDPTMKVEMNVFLRTVFRKHMLFAASAIPTSGAACKRRPCVSGRHKSLQIQLLCGGVVSRFEIDPLLPRC